jgi:hypothetical protein
MRGETSSTRDSRAAGRALPTSRPGSKQQQSENPLLRRRARVARSRCDEQTVLGSPAGGSGTQQQSEELSSSSTGGNDDEGVNLPLVGSGGSTRVDKTSVTVRIGCMRGNDRCNLSCVTIYWTGHVIAG